MALPTSHNVVTAAQLGSTLSAYNTKLNERFKPKQTAVDDPTASGTTTTAIASISQDANGVITVTKKTISGVAPAGHAHGNLTSDGKVGSTADYAVVTTTGGAITATSLATSAPTASGNALSFIDSVSQASNGKITATKKSVTVDSTYSATGTNPANGKAIAAAIGTLDVTAIEGAASKTITSISETDGKISATYSSIAIAESQVTNLTTHLNAKAPLASPALTGTPTAPTADAGTNTTQIATTAFVKAEINAVLDAADAMQFKGTIGSSGATVTALPDTHKAGWTYKVATAGTYAGKTCEVGDMIICVKDGTTASNDDWTVVQNNIDGAVTGPTSSVDARVAVFNGTTGKVIKDSGFTIGKSVPSNAVFTDASVTAVGNHYTPSRDTSADKSASASGATAAWGIDVVKGVTLQTDGKGHVTGISVTSGKIPSNPNTDTKVTQTLVASDNTSEYPILLAPTGQTATTTTTSNFVTGAKYKPSTNTLTVNVSGSSASCTGNAATASAAASGSALETAINGKVSTSTTVNGHALSGNVTVTAADVSAVRYDTASQGLSSTQKSNARTNIGAGTSNLAIGTTATTAAAGNHTHTTSIATSTGTSSIELVPGGKYSISAGGTSYIFQNGTEMTDDEVTDLLAALT